MRKVTDHACSIISVAIMNIDTHIINIITKI